VYRQLHGFKDLVRIIFLFFFGIVCHKAFKIHFFCVLKVVDNKYVNHHLCCVVSVYRIMTSFAKYRALPLRLNISVVEKFTDIDHVSVTDLPVSLLYDIQGSEVELCCRMVLKPVRDDAGCCVIDHPAYVYIKNEYKGAVIEHISNTTGHSFLHASVMMNVFLGTPTPRRCSNLDFCRCITAAGVQSVDFEVYGQKATIESYYWFSNLPDHSTITIDLGRYRLAYRMPLTVLRHLM
jgi:hypothetical protein